MLRFTLSAIALLAASVAAQTSTECNPLNSTCSTDPALGTTFTENYTASDTEFNPAIWNVTDGESLISFGPQGAELAIVKNGDTVTVVSNFYIFWGQTSFIMKAANGTGIISTAILLSDDLDEIDWEIMGGNGSFVENNYYGQGNQSQRFAQYEPLNGAQDGFHNYTINWTQEQFQYLIDGNVVRTVSYAEPGLYPQTPMRVRFGIWAGGASSQPGTVAWAGGKTDFGDGPFTMYIQSITVTDGTQNSSSYAYGDHSGSYQSIQVTNGVSAAYKALNKAGELQSVEQRWNGLSKTAKIAIAASVIGVFALLVIFFTVYCAIQRKKGRAEKAIADREWDNQTNELLEYKRMMAKGEFAVNHMGHGERF